MRTLLLVATAVLTLPCQAAESQFWGPTVDGLRMSVTRTQAEAALKIVIQNVSQVERRVLLGGMTGIGPLYATLHFAVISPAGKRFQMHYADAGFVGGYVSPLIATISPGGSYELLLPLTKFWVMGGPKDKLNELINAGWAVEASIEVTPEQAGSLSQWSGRLVSGKMRY